MWFVIPLFAIGVLPTVWVGDRFCGTDAMVETLHSLRPDLVVHTKEAQTEGDLTLRLERSGNKYVVRLNGDSTDVTRSFPDPGDCAAAGRTAALMVDGALDELPPPSSPLTLPPLITPQPKPDWTLSASFGWGGRESLLGASMTLSGGLWFQQGIFESRAELEFGLPSLKPLLPGPESVGFYSAWGVTPVLLEGIGLQAGPGRLSIAGEAGMEFAFLAAQGLAIAKFTPQTILEPFGGLRVAWSLPLPNGFFLTPQLEERLAPAQARFDVEGVPFHVTTRSWTLAGALVLGRRLF